MGLYALHINGQIGVTNEERNKIRHAIATLEVAWQYGYDKEEARSAIDEVLGRHLERDNGEERKAEEE